MTDAERKFQERIRATQDELERLNRMQEEKITGMMMAAGQTMDDAIQLTREAETDSERLDATNALLIGLCQSVSAIMMMMYEKRGD